MDVVGDKKENDKVFDVFHYEEEPCHAFDVTEDQPHTRRQNTSQGVPGDGPIQRCLPYQPQLLVHRHAGKPGETHDDEKHVLCADRDTTSTGRRTGPGESPHTEFGGQKHREDENIETCFGTHEADDEDADADRDGAAHQIRSKSQKRRQGDTDASDHHQHRPLSATIWRLE